MNIALVNSEYPSATGIGQGGIATYTYTMAEALRSSGHTVYVLVRKGTEPTSIPKGITTLFYEYTPETSILSRLKNRIQPDALQWERGHAFGLRNLLLDLHNKTNIDIAEFPEYGGMAFGCAPPLPFPVVVNFHMPTIFVDQLNNITPDKHRMQQYAFEETAIKNGVAYRCPSKAMQKEVCALYGLHPDTVTVIPNPISTQIFDAIAKKHSSDTRFHVLFTGRLEQRKGADILLNSIKEILRIDKRINITIAGETRINNATDYQQVIERTLNQEQRQRVWFLGAIDRKELTILYCRSSLLLVPSLFENAPYSILEAMASRLPVVASSGSGISELITHNKTGLLFDLKQPLSLLPCIQELFDKPDYGVQLASNAYDYIATTCSPEVITEAAISLYTAVIGSR